MIRTVLATVCLVLGVLMVATGTADDVPLVVMVGALLLAEYDLLRHEFGEKGR